MAAADPFAPTQAGRPLDISASWYNAVSRAALDAARRQLGAGGGSLEDYRLSTLTAFVRNDTGAALGAWSILRISGSVTDPATLPFEFQRSPMFTGAAPAAATDRFCILVEPVPNGAYGRAVIAGLAVCRVDVTDAAHTFAAPAAGDTAKLASATDGPAAILWKESGTGTKWAVVLLADYRAGGSQLFVKITGGEVQPAGSGFWPCVLTVPNANSPYYTDDATAAVFRPLTGFQAHSGHRYGPVKDCGANTEGKAGIDGKTVYAGMAWPLTVCVDVPSDIACQDDGGAAVSAFQRLRVIDLECPVDEQPPDGGGDEDGGRAAWWGDGGRYAGAVELYGAEASGANLG